MILYILYDLNGFFLFFLFNVDRSLVTLAMKLARPRFRRDPEVLDLIDTTTKRAYNDRILAPCNYCHHP